MGKQRRWAVDGDFGGRNKEKWTPVTDTYKPNFEPWIETVEYQDLLPIIIDAELRYGKNKKPTGYAIPKAIWQSDIYRRPPTTWAAHLRTLEKKRNDPLPKKGVAGRMRSADGSLSAALESQGTGSRVPSVRRRGRTTRATPISALLGEAPKPAAAAGGELTLIASIQAAHERARIHTCGRRQFW